MLRPLNLLLFCLQSCVASPCVASMCVTETIQCQLALTPVRFDITMNIAWECVLLQCAALACLRAAVRSLGIVCKHTCGLCRLKRLNPFNRQQAEHYSAESGRRTGWRAKGGVPSDAAPAAVGRAGRAPSPPEAKPKEEELDEAAEDAPTKEGIERCALGISLVYWLRYCAWGCLVTSVGRYSKATIQVLCECSDVMLGADSDS